MPDPPPSATPPPMPPFVEFMELKYDEAARDDWDARLPVVVPLTERERMLPSMDAVVGPFYRASAR